MVAAQGLPHKQNIIAGDTGSDLGPLEEALGVRFQNQTLLKRSLVHSSYMNENPLEAPESNERLEFLGDALLDFVVAEELYQRYPQMPEGQLTAARAALVRGEALAQVARRLALGDALLLGQGEESSGGRSRGSNLAAVFEALIGAIFLDQGYEGVHTYILNALQPELERISVQGVPEDPKSRLQELIQGQEGRTPNYRIAEELGPDHAKHFVAEALIGDRVAGRGSGRRKAEAEQAAARAALIRIEGEIFQDPSVPE